MGKDEGWIKRGRTGEGCGCGLGCVLISNYIRHNNGIFT